MKLTLVADGWFKRIAEWFALRLGLVPAPFLIRGFLGMGMTQSFVSAANLGIFDALGHEWKSAEQLAQETNCDPGGVEALLKALTGFGYIRRKGGNYRNGREIRRWYLASSSWSMREIAPFIGELWHLMSDLEEGVRTGEVPNFHYAGKSPQFWRHYLRALASFANLSSKEVVRRVPLSSPLRCLDVGGGHGTFSMAFARRHPGLQCTVLDLPEACVVGREWVAEHEMDERVHYQEGDLRTADWGEEYDLVLLFNLLHTLSPEESQLACERAFSALKPGGSVVVLDAQHRKLGNSIDQLTGFNELFFYLITGGAKPWPEQQIQQWLKDAGFVQPSSKSLWLVPHSVLLSGVKPG
jgi:2-polyprenyl-3-methyl-5-hydroxy-6-metoxy-1,4-benzoquinol methylase